MNTEQIELYNQLVSKKRMKICLSKLIAEMDQRNDMYSSGIAVCNSQFNLNGELLNNLETRQLECNEKLVLVELDIIEANVSVTYESINELYTERSALKEQAAKLSADLNQCSVNRDIILKLMNWYQMAIANYSEDLRNKFASDATRISNEIVNIQRQIQELGFGSIDQEE